MYQGRLSSTEFGALEVLPSAVVAIPVYNEAERVLSCLDALADQKGLPPGSLGIVLFLNNCTDDTAEIVRAYAKMPWPMRIVEATTASPSAGWARRMAMAQAADWMAEDGHDGILLTTDADSRVGVDWVARNLAAIANGADLVAGRIVLDADEAAALPERLHARARLEAEYESLLAEIDARLDPDPGNPWPCHWSKSGATLAVRYHVYRAAGGMPEIPTGEDRAFVDAVRACGFVVRHLRDIEVITSGRLKGRAAGGVADTMRLRCDEPESSCDDRLERLPRLLARIAWRRRLRRLHANGQLSATWRWAPYLRISSIVANAMLTSDGFGFVHAAIEASSPQLAYRPVRPQELPRQIRHASRLLRVLRALDRWNSVCAQCRAPRLLLCMAEQPSRT